MAIETKEQIEDQIRSAARTGVLLDLSSANLSIDGKWLSDFLIDPRVVMHPRGLRIQSASISGRFNLEGAVVGVRLALTGCDFGSHSLNIVETSLRRLDLSGSRCEGIRADRVVVDGDLLLRKGFVSTGEVSISGAIIGGILDLSGAEFAGDDSEHALKLGGSRVGGSVLLRDGFEARAMIDLRGASIGGSFVADGGAFNSAGGLSIVGDGVQIAGDMVCSEGFSTEGAVRLRDASIQGHLDLEGGTISNPEGTAVDADGIRVGRNVLLRNGFRAQGSIQFVGARIGGTLDCDRGTFIERRVGYSEPRRYALHFDRSQIGGNVFLRDGFVADGGVRFSGATIGSQFDCTGASLEYPERNALFADGIKVGGSITFRGGFEAVGVVSLRDASVDVDVVCSEARFTNPGREALRLNGSVVKGGLYLRGAMFVDGEFDLAGAQVESLHDGEDCWPEEMNLVGFTYGRLESERLDAEGRRRWLCRMSRFDAQPYLQLAKVLREQGHERDARQILMARHNVQIHPPEKWALHRSWLWRLWHSFLRYTIGHGYAPWRAVFVAVPLLAAMSVFYSYAARNDMLIPTAQDPSRPDQAGVDPIFSSECDRYYPCVQPVILTIDTLLPLVDLGQRGVWAPDRSRWQGEALAWATWTTTLLGWVLASLVAVGFTNVVKHE